MHGVVGRSSCSTSCLVAVLCNTKGPIICILTNKVHMQHNVNIKIKFFIASNVNEMTIDRIKTNMTNVSSLNLQTD